MIFLGNIKKIIEIKNFRHLYFIGFLIIILSIIETLSIGMIFPLLDYFASKDTSIIQLDFLNFTKLDLTENQIASTIIFLFVFFFILKFILQVVIEWINTTFFQNLKVFVSEKVIKKHFSFKSIDNSTIKNTTEFSNLSVVETERYCNKFIGGLVNIFAESLTIIFISVMLFIFSTKYSILISLFYGSIVFVIFILIKKYLVKISFKRLFHHEEIMKIAKEGFDGHKEIIIYNAKDKFVDNFRKNSLKLGNINRNESFIQSMPRFLIELLTIMIFAFVIFYIFSFSELTFNEVAPSLGLFALAALRIYPGVTRILANVQSIKASVAIESKIISYLDKKDLNTNFDKIENINNNFTFNKEIRIEKLSYEIDGRIILKDLNLTIKKNEFVGIYGESGSGKTTLLNLLMGFYEPTSGKILIDDSTLDNNSFKNWIKKIGYVGQNSFLLNDTIENNIALSSKEVDTSRVNQSINLAQLSNFFKGDINLKSYLREYASNISGGEKQRFAIARAIYKDAEVLFFDEPTSSLDNKTASKFLEVVNTFHKKKTMFMISHKIENLKNCDKILILDDATITEK